MKSTRLTSLGILLAAALLCSCGARSSLSARAIVDGPGGGGGGSGGGEACGAVVCDAPPAAACVSAMTLRTWSLPGACVAGTCEYGLVETECPSGCEAGMCSAKAKAVMIGAGNDSTCAVTTAGAATCWGGNENGQLGNGSMAGSLVPVDVVGLSAGVVAVSATAGCTCVVTAAGAVECWGSNGFGSGQLGNGTTTDSVVPVDVVGLSSGVAAVSTGGRHTCAVTSAGAVKCWGSNDLGELGNGSTKSSLVPVDVVGLSSGVVAVSAGVTTTCALLATGAVKCWGYNVFGQLGNDSTADSHVPVDVVGLGSGVVAVSAGSDYACAVTAAGAARCWGYNGYGQLGDGTTIHRHVPVDVLNLSSGVLAISTGDSHTCAVTATGAVACWGIDKDGELGDGSTTDSAVPVAVVGLPSEIVSVTVGAGAHTCAVTSTGAITCWGNNVYGQLGNGSMSSSLAPVDVVGF